MKKLIYLTAAFALTMAACNKESGDTASDTVTPNDGTIRVEATRTSASESFGGGELSLSVIYDDQYPNDPETDPYTVVDSKWTKDATSGVWSTDDVVLWRNSTDKVDIYAFTPYVANMYANMESGVNFAVSTDQASNNVYSSDLMVYNYEDFTPSINADDTTGGYLTSTGAVPITFTHTLSQLVISLTYGDEFDDVYDGNSPTVKSVTLHAVTNLRYTFADESIALGTYTNGVLVEDSNVVNDILTYKSGDDEYTVILPPQTFSADTDMITITVDAGGKGDDADYEDFIFTVPASTTYSFSAKNTYTMSIRVGKDTVKLDGDSITETPWSDGGEVGGGDSELDRTSY